MDLACSLDIFAKSLAIILPRFLQDSFKNLVKVLPRYFTWVVHILMPKSSEFGMRLGGGNVGQLK